MATTGFNAGLDSSDAILSYAKEATYATNPATSMTKLRMTGEGFTETKSRTRPSEIEARGQAAAALTTQVEASGTLNFGFSFGTYDDLLQSLIMSDDWSADVKLSAATIAATNTVGIGGNGPGFTDSGNGMGIFSVGDWVHVSGFTASPDTSNGYFRVIAVAAGEIEVDGLGSGDIVVEAVGDSVVIRNDGRVRNSSTVNTFYVQKELASNLYFAYPGSYPTGGSLTAAVGGFFEGSMNFVARSEENQTSTFAGSPEYIEAPTGKVVDTIVGIKDTQYRNDTDAAAWTSLTSGTILQSMNLNFNKENSRLQFGIGSTDAAGMARGTLNVDGTAAIYFKDFALYNLYAGEKTTEFAFRVIDSDGRGYVFSLPAVTLTNPNIVAGAPDTDLVAEFTLEGGPGTGDSGVTLPFTFQIDRFDID